MSEFWAKVQHTLIYVFRILPPADFLKRESKVIKASVRAYEGEVNVLLKFDLVCVHYVM